MHDIILDFNIIDWTHFIQHCSDYLRMSGRLLLYFVVISTSEGLSVLSHSLSSLILNEVIDHFFLYVDLLGSSEGKDKMSRLL